MVIAVLAASLARLTLGCGTQSGHGSPPSGGSSWSPVCPESLPTIDSSCFNPVAEPPCEYGNAWWDTGCDTIVQCTTNAWNLVDVANETCFPAPGPNSADCPRDGSAIGVGTACAQSGLTCYYDGGTACACAAGSHADAGTTWQCNPDPGCPIPRPRFGASCSRERTCNYGVEPNVIGEQCINGFWQPPSTYTPPVAPPPASGCPRDPATIGGACAMPGLTCHYGDATCQCFMSIGPDAGSSWECEPGPGCPNPWPGLGASCYTGSACIYGEGNDLQCVQCTSGSWQTAPGPCPNGGP
ncbi:MAG TPA: hypothetical protein VF765_26430 [Polyangiaceae bacterium]